MTRIFAALSLSLVMTTSFVPVTQAAPPNVVVSIKPLHSLVAGVMDGVSTPELLLKGGASPHHYALKPSEAKLLSNAQLVISIGPNMEVFLIKPLAVRVPTDCDHLFQAIATMLWRGVTGAVG